MKQIINYCTATPHWNGCKERDKMEEENRAEYTAKGCKCWSQNSGHKCIKLMRVYGGLKQ